MLVRRKIGALLGWILGWTWTIIAGGGGLWLLWTKGPGRLTNGWFALCSGVSACPLITWFLKRYFGLRTTGWVQLSCAVLFFIAGKIALRVGM